MVIIDAKAGKVLAELPIGAHSDAAAFDPALEMAYSSNGDGTLTVVHEDDPNHFRVVANITTQEGARTMTLDPARAGFIWLGHLTGRHLRRLQRCQSHANRSCPAAFALSSLRPSCRPEAGSPRILLHQSSCFIHV